MSPLIDVEALERRFQLGGSPINTIKELLAEGTLVEGAIPLIIFDDMGQVIFGATLLAAIVESNTSVPAIVVHGIPSTAFKN